MAFLVGTKNYIGGTNPVLPIPDANSRGGMLYNNGTTAYWAYPGSAGAAVGTGFEYRSIFTHGFMAGGYKGSNPWRSVNKTWHSTDITTYCGEQLEYASAYHEGMFSDYNGYIAGAQGDSDSGSSHGTASARTVSINLHNGNGRSRGQDTYGPYSTFGFGSGFNETGAANAQGPGDASVGVVGGWNGNVVKLYTGCASNIIGQVGYDVGGNNSAGSSQNNSNKLHFGTEIMYGGPTLPTSGPTGGCGGKDYGYFSINGSRYKMKYADDVFSSITTSGGTSWSYKWLPSKKGFVYSTANSVYYKFSESTFVDLASYTSLFAQGEENYEMGQEWGYQLGGYNGNQNNYTAKYNYSTDAMTTLGAASRPKGHYGQSSAACFSAAATITSANVI